MGIRNKMRKEKRKDFFYLFLILGLAVPAVLYYAIHFYRLFDQKSLIGQNLCLIISAVFLWGVADILNHYLAIIKEHDHLERFQRTFPGQSEKDQNFTHSIIGHRFRVITCLKNSLSQISHESLTDIISTSESRRAALAKYLIGVCVLLGLLGTFLGLLETVSGAYLAIEEVNGADQLLKSLHHPLNGMSLAFGTSVLGIVSSLALGFAYLFFYQRQLLFLSELEEFTQTRLIPELTRSDKKILEEILAELRQIRKDIIRFTPLGQELQQGIQDLLSSLSDRYADLTETVQQQIQNILQALNEKIIEKITTQTQTSSQSIQLLAKKMGFSAESLNKQVAIKMQEQIELVHTLLKSQAEHSFSRLEDGLKVYQDTLEQASQILGQTMRENIREFRETLHEERLNRETALEKFTRIGSLLEEASRLIQANQAELQATIAMFGEGVDKVLDYFSQPGSEKEFLETLQDSLTLFHERASSVLMEYAARSKEVMSGLLENQLHLNREIQKMK